MTKRMAFVTLVTGGLAMMPSLVAQRPATSAPASLVGTWTLSSYDQRFKGGAPTRIGNARGIIVFDSAGHALEVATHAGRPAYAANQPAPAEAHVTFDNYSGFWGGYRVDQRAGQIIFHPEGAVHPNIMGQDLPRSYELNGDKLTITALDAEPNARVGTKWTWERVPPVDNLSPTYRKVVGFWRHVVEKRVNLTTGAQVSENERAPSIIVYTPAGFVGVHFPPLNRKKFAADVPTDDEARAAIQGYVGYYGALTVYPGMVFHHRLAMLGPTQGDTLKRFFEVVGDEIHLKFPPNVNQQGQATTTLVTLKRLSGDKEMLGTAK